jgi:hypothetical protein
MLSYVAAKERVRADHERVRDSEGGAAAWPAVFGRGAAVDCSERLSRGLLLQILYSGGASSSRAVAIQRLCFTGSWAWPRMRKCGTRSILKESRREPVAASRIATRSPFFPHEAGGYARSGLSTA